MEKRVARAETLISLGEISAARLALEGSPAAPGSDETLSALTDESGRPPEPRDPIPILQSRPTVPFELDKEVFLQNLRTASMRSEHLRPLLDGEGDRERDKP